jgi:NO-binding membrane sensor protein with MHYT domain
MFGYYSPSLVTLSIAIAILASYTALDLANRVKEGASNHRKSWAWLVAGALSMGIGIWSMHFIGMLAFHLPTAVAYDLPITALSLVIAIGVSTVALAVFRQPELRVKNVLACAFLMGIGIAAMHYTGMIAMRMSPPIAYDPVLFVASVLIAILASAAALWIAFMLRKSFARLAIVAKLAGAGVMGLAIAGMHYTGMAAARFAPDSVCLAAGVGGGGISSTTLGLVIGGFAMVILSFTLVLSTLDAHFAVKITLLARTDSLTGLANRATFTERLSQLFAAAKRGATPFAILFLDLDKFKSVNDTFGHPIGDLLLLEVAERLKRSTRETDLVARLGGDEFAILQGEVKEPANAGALAEKIQSTLALP